MNSEVKYSGRLQYFQHVWSEITHDPTIHSWLKGYKIPFICEPTCFENVTTNSKSKTELQLFVKSINSLLDIGAISKCDNEEHEFLSSVFLVPKPNGDHRFILNLKRLNKYIKNIHFKMEDYRTALKLMSNNCYMATIDMKDAYFLVPIHENHKKYLKFSFNDTLYQFNCLPFGLSTAPYVFTKMLKPVMEYLRSRNMISVIYLDDISCIGRSYNECEENIRLTKDTLESLGFIINDKKSCFIPKTECKFLGFIFDSKNMILKLPDDKKLKIKKLLLEFKKLKSCRLRDFAKFVGTLTSACPALQYAWLYTKSFERHKYLCLLNNNDYDQIINLPSSLDKDIKWWLNNIDNGCYPFRFNDFKLEIFSDASSSGWGACCNGKEASGYWRDDEKRLHINILELKAALFALKIFAKNMSGCEILLRIDNVTAISCINRMGSIQYPHLHKIAQSLWQWCERRKITVFASYTKDNYEADFLSRKKFEDIEWELNSSAFRKIVAIFGKPDIDLFASRCNTKCKTYISWKHDPNAWAIDAFTVSWANMFFYAFPPFSLILKMLQKVIFDRANGVVVVPYWPTQPWYPVLQKLIVSKPIYFQPQPNLLKSPFRSTHSLHKTLTLIAVRLSGERY